MWPVAGPAGEELAAEGLAAAHKEHGLRHLGHTGVLLVRSEPLHGEQLQLAPHFTHGAGLGAAGNARLSVQSGAGALAARNVGWKSSVRLRSGSLCPRLLLGAAPDPDAGDALTVRPHGAALHLFWSGHGLPWDAGRVLYRAHRRACGQKEIKASTLLAELLKTGPDKGQKSYKSQKVNKRVVNFLADT